MTKTIVINPSEISKGDPQKISANLKKFNKAEAMVQLAVDALEPFKVITSAEQQTNAIAVMKEANTVSKAIEDRRKVLVKPFNDSVGEINAFAKGLCGKIDPLVATTKNAVLAFQKSEDERILKLRTTARIEVLTQLGFELKDGAYRMENIGMLSENEVKNYDDPIFKGLIDGFTNSIKIQSEKAATAIAEEKEEEDELASIFGDDDSSDVIEAVVSTPVVASAPAPVYNGSAFATTSVKGATKRWTYEVTDLSLVPREYMVIDSAAIRKAITEGTRSIAGIRIFQEDGLSLR